MRRINTKETHSEARSPSRSVLSALSGGLIRDGFVRDERGAAMVMGIFVAMFLVAMMYFVWGIGEAVLQRERMQDAADTAAFSAAVIHARGMNMLALLNMIMAAAAAVAATMSTAASMITGAAVAAGATCIGCPFGCGYCCDACVDGVQHGIDAVDAHDTANDVEDFVEGVMEGISAYAGGIRTGAPFVAQGKVVQYGTNMYAPTTDAGFMVPIVESLPAEGDPSNWPCDEKVLPTVRWTAPVAAAAQTNLTEWLVAGVIYGEIRARGITRDWCEDEYFQRVEPDARPMGDDAFQVQSYMIGRPPSELNQRWVALATWGREPDAGNVYSNIGELGRFSFAQAEFMYDDDERDYREWLWHMNWRARLRRWRLGGTGGFDLSNVMNLCGSETGSDSCGELGGLSDAISNLVVH